MELQNKHFGGGRGGHFSVFLSSNSSSTQLLPRGLSFMDCIIRVSCPYLTLEFSLWEKSPGVRKAKETYVWVFNSLLPPCKAMIWLFSFIQVHPPLPPPQWTILESYSSLWILLTLFSLPFSFLSMSFKSFLLLLLQDIASSLVGSL